MKVGKILFALAAGALLLLTVGCNNSSSSTTTPATPKVVTIFGSPIQEEARQFELAFKSFEEKTGIKIQYEGSKEFETLIKVRVEGGNPPDIAGLPQPGMMKTFASNKKLVPLWPEAVAKIEKNYSPAWKDLGSANGVTYGVFHRVNVKSLVWYPKKAWEKAGYPIPKTWDELKSLSNKLVAEGKTPWAVGIESGGATGWVGTDWIEDIMLRTAGPEAYDKWVSHELPFSSPEVKNAFKVLADIWLTPKYVYGGATSILTTPFGDSPKILFDNPPKGWMHRQASFITGFFPEAIQGAAVAQEAGVFALPSINPAYGIPALGGGDQWVVFNDRPEVRAALEFLATGESTVTWAKAGGALFPHKDQDMNNYPDAITRAQADLLVNAQVFRFDASDLMPAEVGAGSFWKGMVDFVGGKDLDAVLKAIDDSWPKK